MVHLNTTAKDKNTYDAIVIGSGISGGYAAMELTKKGLKTLVLERGRMIKHGDYPTATLDKWDFPNRGLLTDEQLAQQAKQARTENYTITAATKDYFVNDIENPYTEIKRFDWMRGYHVGGRSLMWGRHCYRWSDLDFEANAKEGVAIDWPIRYKDIEPWYDYVEPFVGISGRAEGLPQLPDGKFLPPIELNCVEQDFVKSVAKNFGGRVVTEGRVANLSERRDIHGSRGQCQSRNRCMRGCPFGGYFSSNSATLPVAEATGNLTIRPMAIVQEIMYDKETKKATGVRIMDAETKEIKEYYAKIIFCNASTLGSTQILMNSKSERFPDGMGNDSGALGHYLMDHHFKAGASARIEGYEDMYYKGRRPNGIYIPRYRNLNGNAKSNNYTRGFGYQGGAGRSDWGRLVSEYSFGEELKNEGFTPGQWGIGFTGFGETLPYKENKVMLNEEVKDKYGMNTLTFDCEWKENELNMQDAMMNDCAEMLEAAGYKDVSPYKGGSYPGLGIHEMGTARMGKDPKTSVLNKYNQIHAVKNVYITDGACMTSSACQNPSITYIALTARACDHAVKELKRQNL